MKAQLIIDRLDMVRANGKDRYIARCPAHDDKSPSLSITQKEDGRVLIYCFGGCGTTEILDALSLDYSVLFPDTQNHFPGFRKRPRGPAVDDLTLAIADADRAAGKKLSKEDREQELQAFLRQRSHA